MPETISIFCGSVEDISPIGKDSLEVTLADVELSHLIQEVGFENLLDEISKDDIKQYIKDKEQDYQDKRAGWDKGTTVRHNFDGSRGVILEHREDENGYNWLVDWRDYTDPSISIAEDWYKSDVLEEVI